MSSEHTSNEQKSTSSNEQETSSSSDYIDEDELNLELTGDILNNYNVICQLGKGAYSIVWLVYSIKTNNFYALKVQDAREFKDGYSEIKFVEKLPKNPCVFNNLVEYFIEYRENPENKKENLKYLCSVWELHCSDIDSLIRRGNYTNGLPLDMVKKIMKQLIKAISILHKQFRVFHGDIKTDNILIKGINEKDAFIIKRYTEENFFEKYSNEKKNYWTLKGNNIKTIDNMKKSDKLKIRKQVHSEITNKIIQEYMESDINKYNINNKYLDSINISLADFGTHCEEDNYYETSFGTRYYQAPEIILQGECSLPVDIWALGCTFYELLSGKLLFDPIKDSKYSRDYYHLFLINESCGNFPSSFLKNTKHYKQFFTKTYNLKDYEQTNINRIDRKLNEIENISSSDKEIIKKILNDMLQIDPNKRIKINDLLKVNFFD